MFDLLAGVTGGAIVDPTLQGDRPLANLRNHRLNLEDLGYLIGHFEHL